MNEQADAAEAETPVGVVFRVGGGPNIRVGGTRELVWTATLLNRSREPLDDATVWASSSWGPKALVGPQRLESGTDRTGHLFVPEGADVASSSFYATFRVNGRKWRIDAVGTCPTEIVDPDRPDGVPDDFPEDVGRRRYILWGRHFGPLDERTPERIVPPADDRESWRAQQEHVRHGLARNPGAHFLFGEPGAARLADRLLFRYMPADRLRVLAETKRLRMSRLQAMNDPRESRPWVWGQMVVGAGPGIDITTDDHERARQFADDVESLRRCTLQVCFGQQLVAGSDPFADRPTPGYLQPRMWSQYASEHQGACVIFDRRKLDRAFAHHLGDRRAVARDISYSNAGSDQLFAGTVYYETGAPVSPMEFLAKHHRDILFVKSPDWASEREYRWVVLNDDPDLGHVDVPISGCVLGLVLGDRFAEYDDAWCFAKEFDVEQNVAICRWSGPLSDHAALLTPAGPPAAEAT